jgi:hypothetical protein
MKRNLIQLVAVMLLLTAKVAQAQESTIEMQVEAQVQEAMRLARINVLLRELVKAKAVEIDEAGKIVVKQSIREQLLKRNLLQSAGGAQGGLCD